MSAGDKPVTEGRFDEWVRNLAKQINQLWIALQQFQEAETPTFIALPDTPNTYAGSGRRPVLVSAAEDGLSFGGYGRYDIESAAISDPPLAAEINALFPGAPDGFGAFVQDTDGPLWFVIKSSGSWKAFKAITLG